jgi:hypothetical protein
MKNETLHNTADRRVKEAGSLLCEEAPGYRYVGSATVHIFKSNIVGFQTAVQLQISEVPESAMIEAAKHLKLMMMRAYGHEQRNVGERETDDQANPSIG